MQTHNHLLSVQTAGAGASEGLATNAYVYPRLTTANNSGRTGTTTHGKQKGVKYIIKVL